MMIKSVLDLKTLSVSNQMKHLSGGSLNMSVPCSKKRLLLYELLKYMATVGNTLGRV